MSLPSSQNLRRLPLHSRHVSLGAKLGNFGEWEVPLYFTTILEEHEAVRNQAGLFDISHMGKFWIAGEGAQVFLENLLPRWISRMHDGQALYMPLLKEDGGMLDDIIVYRITANEYWIIVNASNVDKDRAWIESQTPANVRFEDRTSRLSLIALQGPAAARALEKALGVSTFSSLRKYHFAPWKDGMIARTGYTGEDGFEILASAADIEKLWDQLLALEGNEKVFPIGFGARDTLRLEAGMLLYGHDMNEGATPLECGIGWTLNWDKPAFVAKEALEQKKKQPPSRQLVGFEMVDRGIPRQDYEIRKDGSKTGVVTSGSFSPTLKKNIGMGYVAPAAAEPGTEIEIIVRDKPLKAKVVKLPFYKRK